MGLFSSLKMAMLGTLVVIVLAPATSASFLKRVLLLLIGLGLITTIYVKNEVSRAL
ncbi:hypothetical protein [Pyrobaculum islandicum]|uniref:hypothetical protein n=1 Tax=Pyrobaculum islandicum TaxID=2277 RepID=UPI000A57722A|nr:hypothetical protein [Pyrobaculum islandicum]